MPLFDIHVQYDSDFPDDDAGTIHTLIVKALTSLGFYDVKVKVTETGVPSRV